MSLIFINRINFDLLRWLIYSDNEILPTIIHILHFLFCQIFFILEALFFFKYPKTMYLKLRYAFPQFCFLWSMNTSNTPNLYPHFFSFSFGVYCTLISYLILSAKVLTVREMRATISLLEFSMWLRNESYFSCPSLKYNAPHKFTFFFFL